MSMYEEWYGKPAPFATRKSPGGSVIDAEYVAGPVMSGFDAAPRPGVMSGSIYTQVEWNALNAKLTGAAQMLFGALDQARAKINRAVTVPSSVSAAIQTVAQSLASTLFSAPLANLIGSTVAPGDPIKRNALNALANVESSLARYVTMIGTRVYSGALTPAAWMDGLKTVSDAIVYILRDVGEVTVLAQVKSTVSQVTAEVDGLVAQFKKAGLIIAGLSTAAIVGVVVVALLIGIPVLREVLRTYTAPLRAGRMGGLKLRRMRRRRLRA